MGMTIGNTNAVVKEDIARILRAKSVVIDRRSIDIRETITIGIVSFLVISVGGISFHDLSLISQCTLSHVSSERS
jgi:hypothetical protein